ncbi:hypothetical protein HORIV_51330 [Vreelandella olivaria]|uniref:Uncharacterized protein n=1 Tax=Vreelandella olivaria TaxID=390919 RepID=A0ABN5X7B8_9GAMM|nr:hypothetical protein HORIV_51330 [Halomonas olivaria]
MPVIMIDALALMLPQSGIIELQKHGVDLPTWNVQLEIIRHIAKLQSSSREVFSKDSELT